MANNKEIKYNGISAVPSDYDSPDGDLTVAINLINDDGELSSVSQPVRKLKLQPDESLIIIHKVAGQKNYILRRTISGGSDRFYWIVDSEKTTDTGSAEFICSIDGFSDIAVMGNTLCIASTEGVRYILWQEGHYISLGARPPEITIDFTAVDRCTDIRQTTVELPFNLTEATKLVAQPDFGFSVADQYISDLSNSVMGLINKKIKDYCSSRGYFWQPFFVRYAYRLFDATHSWISPPVLILPTTLLPVVSCRASTLHFDFVSGSGESFSPICGLAYRIVDVDTKALALWKDIIAGIDIFVSPPILTYDPQSRIRDFLNFRTAQESSPALVEADRSLFYPGNYARTTGDYNDPRDNPDLEFIKDVSPDPFPESVDFSYREINIPADDSTAYADMYTSACYAKLSPNPDFVSQIMGVSNFYHVHTYEIDDIVPMDSFKWVDVDCPTDDTLRTRPVLEESQSALYDIRPSRLYAYNSRLHMFQSELTPPDPFPLRASVAFQLPQKGLSFDEPFDVNIKIRTKYNGVALSLDTDDLVVDSSGEKDKYTCTARPPRYFYYPDPNASLAAVSESGFRTYYLPLRQSDFLNGAHFFAGLAPFSRLLVGDRSLLRKPSPDPFISTARSVEINSAIFVSAVNNPFSFPISSKFEIGTGSVFGLSSAAKALSQGQFGQFPLYAFTSEGVWALETTSTGTYSARQPITRDVCISSAAITQIDSSVLFATDRGIMLISGSQTQCISDAINNDSPIDLLTALPGLEKLNPDHNTCLRIAPFREFLKTSAMIYDYVHQRIIVYSTHHTYAYIYSLQSRLWGMMLSNLESNVNSYPEALAINGKGELVDFSTDSAEECSGLLVTRPLKLGAPDIHKTIDNVIQRGNFRRGHVRSVLYGSRDLINWHLVWSSKDHFLRGFRGTPYKYFRIALLCDLSPDESLSGASVQFTPRLTNQPR